MGKVLSMFSETEANVSDNMSLAWNQLNQQNDSIVSNIGATVQYTEATA